MCDFSVWEHLVCVSGKSCRCAPMCIQVLGVALTVHDLRLHGKASAFAPSSLKLLPGDHARGVADRLYQPPFKTFVSAWPLVTGRQARGFVVPSWCSALTSCETLKINPSPDARAGTAGGAGAGPARAEERAGLVRALQQLGCAHVTSAYWDRLPGAGASGNLARNPGLARHLSPCQRARRACSSLPHA